MVNYKVEGLQEWDANRNISWNSWRAGKAGTNLCFWLWGLRKEDSGRSYVLRMHLENSCSWDLFGLKQHKNHLLCPTHNPVMDNQNIICRVLRGLSKFWGQRFGGFFFNFFFSYESQEQIEICWLQHLKDGSKLAWNFQTLLGIRAYVQKSIRYPEKVRSRGNLVYHPSRIVIIMFADNFLMPTVTVALFPPSHYRNSIFLSCSCCLLCLPSALGGFSHVHICSFWVLLSVNSCRLILDRAGFFFCVHTQASLWTKDFKGSW